MRTPFSLLFFLPFSLLNAQPEFPEIYDSHSAETKGIPGVSYQTGFIPLVTPANEWIVDWIFPVPGWPREIHRLTFSPDSALIGDHYFHELIYSRNMSGGPWISTDRFLREDQDRVYMMYGNEEFLLYDFKLSIGDTLAAFHLPSETRTVTEVGTIMLNDGIPRKTVTLTCDGGDEVHWIEGMGDVQKLFHTESHCGLLEEEGTQRLIRCFSTNGELLYLRDDVAGCYVSATEEASVNEVTVFPNPAGNYIIIDFEDLYSIDQIRIFDAMGRYSGVSFETDLDDKLDISGLAPGFYVGEIILKDGRKEVFKFCKQ